MNNFLDLHDFKYLLLIEAKLRDVSIVKLDLDKNLYDYISRKINAEFVVDDDFISNYKTNKNVIYSIIYNHNINHNLINKIEKRTDLLSITEFNKCIKTALDNIWYNKLSETAQTFDVHFKEDKFHIILICKIKNPKLKIVEVMVSTILNDGLINKIDKKITL